MDYVHNAMVEILHHTGVPPGYLRDICGPEPRDAMKRLWTQWGFAETDLDLVGRLLELQAEPIVVRSKIECAPLSAFYGAINWNQLSTSKGYLVNPFLELNDYFENVQAVNSFLARRDIVIPDMVQWCGGSFGNEDGLVRVNIHGRKQP
jgi:hypothetical protein